MSVRALILGATGETGKEVLKELINADAVTKVVVVGRRQVESITDPKVRAAFLPPTLVVILALLLIFRLSKGSLTLTTSTITEMHSKKWMLPTAVLARQGFWIELLYSIAI